MSILFLKKLSIKYNINLQIVKSWFLKWVFFNEKTWIDFFDKNKYIVKAKPFLKWAWWKRQLIPQLNKLFPQDFNNYFEPFLGGWSVFFNIQKEKSFLSDINEELINTYQVIKNNPQELIKFLKTLKYSKEFYYKIRSWDRTEKWLKNYTNIERAWRFLYLNKTCFNGLYRVNSKWQFNVPMWKYKNPDFIQEENIINTSKLLNKINVEIKLQSFEKVLDNAQYWDFIYFDPPYDTLTDTANFTSYNENWFWRGMQIKLRDVFVELDKKWCKVMLSNHNTSFIREIFNWFRFEIVKAKRSINSKWTWRGKIDEIVIMNY